MAYWACRTPRCAYAIHASQATGTPKCQTCQAKPNLEKKDLAGIPDARLWAAITELSTWINYDRSDEFAEISDAIAAFDATKHNRDELLELEKLLIPIAKWTGAKTRKYGKTRHPNYGADVNGEFIPHVTKKDSWKESKRSGPVDDLLQVIVGKVQANPTLQAAQAAWNPTGAAFPQQPRAFNAANPYGFLVTCLNDRGGNDPTYVKDIIAEPSLIARGLVSASYITNVVNSTWGSSGFIIKAPQRNIFAAGTANLATKSELGHTDVARKCLEVLQVFLHPRCMPVPASPLLGPAPLVAAMRRLNPGAPAGPANAYLQMNEVVVLGEAPGDNPRQRSTIVEVVGIFVMTGGDKAPSQARRTAYTNASRSKNLPLIDIPLAVGSICKAN